MPIEKAMERGGFGEERYETLELQKAGMGQLPVPLVKALRVSRPGRRMRRYLSNVSSCQSEFILPSD